MVPSGKRWVRNDRCRIEMIEVLIESGIAKTVALAIGKRGARYLRSEQQRALESLDFLSAILAQGAVYQYRCALLLVREALGKYLKRACESQAVMACVMCTVLDAPYRVGNAWIFRGNTCVFTNPGKGVTNTALVTLEQWVTRSTG